MTNNQISEELKNMRACSSEVPCIVISCGTCGEARGALKVVESFKDEIKRQFVGESRRLAPTLRITGCHGFCQVEPNIIIEPKGIFYVKLKPEDVKEIITETIINNKIVDRLSYVDPITGKKIAYEKDIPFYKSQQRLISGNNCKIDPTSIDDYICIGGYKALAKALSTMTPEDIIADIKKSGLRGRGGAGFPTGRKWELCRKAVSGKQLAVSETQKPESLNLAYIICNADEGDPGAYMDRSLLEGNPHSVLEGMIIGAYAIGAKKGGQHHSQGIVYVRNEYPLAVKNINIAIEQAKEYGFLGEDILGSGFDFDIQITKGAGAFVCGEETALILSIEGKKGMPKQRPPYPVQKGVWGKPTNINNVETWANVPSIINNGAEWYSKIGTDKSKGTKIFSLVGKINNTGLVEVPMGISLRKIVYDIGGGIPEGKEFKAVQTGGPSGGCIPKELLDLPVDYEKLAEVGSIMGSGGMIVMDENTCMVDIAKYFMNFLRDESCGKCLSCREGTSRMYEILTDITEARATMEALDLLEELAGVVKDASMCGLGQTAGNPVLSTLRYFRDEYIAHIRDKRCPAGVCKDLITYSIDAELCTGCMACVKICPQEAITGKKKEPHKLEQDKCIKCGACKDICKFNAVKVK
ncbi:MAG: NADH-quinone oxidoreductase subunit NuoF [Candidatus Stahlbacteria bacterium]|nr:NADH-quinone oxidoreductase subunit NuoF [Candidatus Stahlbacteria bacterium]